MKQNLTRRLERLERDSLSRPPVADSARSTGTDAEWLARIEAAGQAGHFEGEPEFGEALAAFRDALAEAEAHPEFDGLWLCQFRFPNLAAAYWWLSELSYRVRNGVPPVGAAEWQELAAWMEENIGRLAGTGLMHPHPKTMPWVCIGVDYLRYVMRGGHRQYHAGEYAELVRQLRATKLRHAE